MGALLWAIRLCFSDTKDEESKHEDSPQFHFPTLCQVDTWSKSVSGVEEEGNFLFVLVAKGQNIVIKITRESIGVPHKSVCSKPLSKYEKTTIAKGDVGFDFEYIKNADAIEENLVILCMFSVYIHLIIQFTDWVTMGSLSPNWLERWTSHSNDGGWSNSNCAERRISSFEDPSKFHSLRILTAGFPHSMMTLHVVHMRLNLWFSSHRTISKTSSRAEGPQEGINITVGYATIKDSMETSSDIPDGILTGML